MVARVALPKLKLGDAIRYARNQWPAPINYVKLWRDALATTVYNTAARGPAAGLPTNSQFFRPMVRARRSRSVSLLSIG